MEAVRSEQLEIVDTNVSVGVLRMPLEACVGIFPQPNHLSHNNVITPCYHIVLVNLLSTG